MAPGGWWGIEYRQSMRGGNLINESRERPVERCQRILGVLGRLCVTRDASEYPPNQIEPIDEGESNSHQP